MPGVLQRIGVAGTLAAGGLYAAFAHASYGQMRLEGAGLLLALVLALLYCALVDLLLFVKLFRYRPPLVVSTLIALALAFFFVAMVAVPGERTGYFKGEPGGLALAALILAGVVFVPFMAAAPIAQHVSLREGLRWPAWVGAGMALQAAAVAGCVVLSVSDHYFAEREVADARSKAREARAGDLAALLRQADEHHERVWGTGFQYPWVQKPRLQITDSPSSFTLGLALGLDDSPLVSAAELLAAADRAALATLLERHFAFFGVPKVRARLAWDSLVPGRLAATLPPELSEETAPYFIERLDKQGLARFCPGGRMPDEDREALRKRAAARGAGEKRPPWAESLQRLEQRCPATGQVQLS